MSIRLLTIAALSLLPFGSTAWADYIYTDDGANVNRYLSSTGASVPFVSTIGSSVIGMAYTVYGSSVDILEAGNGQISEYSITGASSVFASGTKLKLSIGIAVNPAGDVFVGGDSGTDIQEYSPTGTYLSTIATGLAVNSLAINSSGQLFEADADGKISEYTISGSTVTSTSVYATLAPGGTYYGMAFGPSDNLFVSYWSGANSGGIYEIPVGGLAPNATVPTFYTESILLPTGLSYDPNLGTLYMSYANGNGNNGGVDVFNPAGGVPGAALTNTANSFATDATEQPYGIVAITPEPGTWLMFAGGLLSLALFRKYFSADPKAGAHSGR